MINNGTDIYSCFMHRVFSQGFIKRKVSQRAFLTSEDQRLNGRDLDEIGS